MMQGYKSLQLGFPYETALDDKLILGHSVASLLEMNQFMCLIWLSSETL